MSAPATAAKITRPKPRRTLGRRRLFQTIDQASRQPVVWIVAPPGAGKTTLVSDYLDLRRRNNLWYQVDAEDNDVASLFHYLGLAARQATPRARKALPRLVPEYLPNLDAFFRLFFRALFERLPASCVLVFDNYQEVAVDAAFHQALCEAVAQMREGDQFFIVSRADPPAAFARLQAHGQMARIDWSELKFRREESHHLMRLLRSRPLTREVLQRLHELSDGWVAGLLLLLEAPKAGDVAPRRRGDFVPQVVFDYFASQIFDRAPLAEQEILLQSAFLVKMTADLVQRLTGQFGAGHVLLDLHRRNYFITRYGDDSATYQYHPLFREFLVNRARAAFDAARLQEIKRAAAALLAQEGHWEDTVHRLRELEDEDGIAALIAHHGGELIGRGEHKTLENWVRALSQETRERTPWTLYWLGIATASRDFSESRLHLERAFAAFEVDGNAGGTYLAWSAIINTTLYQWDDCHPLDHWIGLFDGLQLRHGPIPSHEIETQVASSMLGALLYRQPNHSEIGKWERRCAELLQRSTDREARIALGMVLLLYYYYVCFDLFQAKRLIDALGKDLRHRTSQPLAALHFGWMEGLYHCHLGEFAECLGAAARMERLTEATGVHALDMNIVLLRVCVSLGRGDLGAAGSLLEQARQRALPNSRFQLSQYCCLAALQAVYSGDYIRARGHLERGTALARQTGLPYPLALCDVAAGHLAFAEDSYEHCVQHFCQAKAQMQSPAMEISCSLSDARLAFAIGNEVGGLQGLRHAFALSRQSGVIQSPWWPSAELTQYCMKALNAGIEVSYVQQIARRAGVATDATLVECPRWPWPVKIRTLGCFEVLLDGKPLEFSGRVQQRPLDLLKALIALGGRDVPVNNIIDAIWPDAEADAAQDTFAKALRRLRSLLATPAAITLREKKLSLEPSVVWVDTLLLQRLLAQPTSQVDFAQVLDLYRGGDFLASDTKAPWARSLRERLHDRTLHQLVRRSRTLLQERRYEEAVSLLEKGIEFDPLTEELYFNLMRCHQQLRQQTEGTTAYRRCQRALAASGMTPSPAIEALHREYAGGYDPTSVVMDRTESA
jgi:LuxR family maltose regulon positive regulatory protein